MHGIKFSDIYTSIAAGWRVGMAGVVVAVLSLTAASMAHGTIVRFTTSLGIVDVRLYDSLTPNSVANFLNYVETDRYEGTFIHRVPQFKGPSNENLGSQNFVVQGGGFLLNNSIWAATGIATDPPIGDEFHLSNTRGTLAFAKNALGATSQWFFNVGNNSFLDASNFTVFGRVLGDGMTIVDMIDQLPAANAAVAQNALGEDFDEIPIRNPITQNDITSNEAVMISISTLDYPAGDYNFDGVVDAADFVVWRNTLNSTTNPAADGNGNGIVDIADYFIWRDTFGQTGGAGIVPAAGLQSAVVPEPSIGTVLLLAVVASVAYRATSTICSRCPAVVH
jgi:peptidyl-prolyl cis-trans isomerase A (cyclophilin A)